MKENFDYGLNRLSSDTQQVRPCMLGRRSLGNCSRRYSTSHIHVVGQRTVCQKWFTPSLSKLSSIKKVSAYSLVELLVVLAIVGFVMLLVAPNLSQAIDSTRVKASVREIAASLKATRSKAITSSEEQLVVFNVQDRTLVDHRRTRTLNIPDTVSIDLITADTEKLSEEEAGIRFFRDGSSTGGQIKLELNERNFVVDVNWLTGKVRIYP